MSLHPSSCKRVTRRCLGLICYNPPSDLVLPQLLTRIQGEFCLIRRSIVLTVLCVLFLSQAVTPTVRAVPADDKTYTVEQIVESVILVYGSRPVLEHIRRNGVERGKLTRFNEQGTAEDANYERRFVRGENLDKDKIRLDQKLPTMEYSLVFGDGKLWGLINGAAFTPRQDAAANFLSQHRHSIDSLLRYCLLYTSPSPRDRQKSRMPSSA